jgi:hypothetical protein
MVTGIVTALRRAFHHIPSRPNDRTVHFREFGNAERNKWIMPCPARSSRIGSQAVNYFIEPGMISIAQREELKEAGASLRISGLDMGFEQPVEYPNQDRAGNDVVKSHSSSDGPRALWMVLADGVAHTY